jgi:hypothetical protein
MNCQTFETHVNELARERMMEAATREAATAHAQACRRCTARLADERALTAGLRAFSSDSARSQEAPRRVETALLAAFRAQQQQKTNAPATATISTHASDAAIPFAPRGARESWFAHAWVQGTAVAAAAMLIVFGFSAMRGRLARPDAEGQRASTTLLPSNAPSAATVSASSNDDAISRAAEVAQNSDEEAEMSPVEAVEEAAEEEASKPSYVAPRVAPSRGVRYSNAAYRSGGTSSNAARTTPDVAEITTDFIPLAHGGSFAPGEGGQVLRVELPRSALVSFGLPMNVERAGERVKADVLMGEDGVARAIRFVR